MDRDRLYRFFEGTSSLEEETEVKRWMEASTENKHRFFAERKLFDAMLLLGDERTKKTISCC